MRALTMNTLGSVPVCVCNDAMRVLVLHSWLTGRKNSLWSDALKQGDLRQARSQRSVTSDLHLFQHGQSLQYMYVFETPLCCVVLTRRMAFEFVPFKTSTYITIRNETQWHLTSHHGRRCWLVLICACVNEIRHSVPILYRMFRTNNDK